MKRKMILFALLLIGGGIGNIVVAQRTVVPSDSLSLYENKWVRACDEVKGIYITKSKTATFINFGKPYPNSYFTGVVFAKDVANFHYNIGTYLKNKYVCVEGKVKMYNNKPEIIINQEKQIIFPLEELQGEKPKQE